MVAVLTLVNIILCAVKASISFTISAYLPFILGAVGIEAFSDPAYLKESWELSSGNEAMINVLGILFLAFAAICIFVYFLCWLLGKKQVGWRILALVLFSVDTVLVLIDLFGGDTSLIIDTVFHALVLYYMIAGIAASSKLKSLPEPDPFAAAAPIPDNSGIDDIHEDKLNK